MNATHEVIEDAIKGGWTRYGVREEFRISEEYEYQVMMDNDNGARYWGEWFMVHEILLDPAFWRALGKERGHKYWRDLMLGLMPYIAYGGSIEEYFKSLEK